MDAHSIPAYGPEDHVDGDIILPMLPIDAIRTIVGGIIPVINGPFGRLATIGTVWAVADGDGLTKNPITHQELPGNNSRNVTRPRHVFDGQVNISVLTVGDYNVLAAVGTGPANNRAHSLLKNAAGVAWFTEAHMFALPDGHNLLLAMQ